MTVISSELPVFAHICGDWQLSGLLTLREVGLNIVAAGFAFDSDYVQADGAVELDPVNLPLPHRPHNVEFTLQNLVGLSRLGVIRDCAPDSWGRRVIESMLQAPLNGLGESAYLLHAGSERVGFLDVRRNMNASPPAPSDDWREIELLVEAAERIENGLPIPDELRGIFTQGAGLGGARPKASIRNEEGVSCVAKFTSRGDRFDVPAVECASLRLAARAGLRVPPTTIVDTGRRRLMLVQRFDRYWKQVGGKSLDEAQRVRSRPGDNRVEHRSPFVSGLTLMGCDEFESRDMSYPDLADAMRLYCHRPTVCDDIRELFKRMIFNIFTSNDDDHLRNHGFLWDEALGDWRLSPLYDVVPRASLATERFLHLSIGLQGRLATLDNAVSQCDKFGIRPADAYEAIANIWEVVRDWPVYFEESLVDREDVDFVASAFRSIDEIASPTLRRRLP